jgi:photosystem II stability/assembly factor-like uncharacterized protein
MVTSGATCHKDALSPLPCTEQLGDRCWTYLGPAGVTIIGVAAIDGYVFAATRNGVLRYDIGRNRWASFGLDGLRVVALNADTAPLLAAVANQNQVPTASVLFGLADVSAPRWIPMDGGYAVSNDSFRNAYSVIRAPSNRRQLYLGSNGNILRSDDAGATWRYVQGGPDITGGPVYALAVSETNPDRVWAAGQRVDQLAFVQRSDDGGGSWTGVTPDSTLLGDRVTALASVRSGSGGDVVFAALLGRVFSSDDGGQTWRVSLSVGAPPAAMDIARKDDTLIVVASVPNGDATRQAPTMALYRSVDLGGAWDWLPTPRQATGGTTVARSGDGLLIGTWTGVWLVRSLVEGGP